MRKPWNHNEQYHSFLLRQVPKPCSRALDIGCGDGSFTNKVARLADETIGIDSNADCIALAKDQPGNAQFIHTDFNDCKLPEESFEFVSAVMSIHHLNFENTLMKVRQLLAPGGTLAVLGIARLSNLQDIIFAVAGVCLSRTLRIWYRYREHRSPLSLPNMSYQEVSRKAHEPLPQCKFRRHVLFRYSIVWQKDGSLNESQPHAEM